MERKNREEMGAGLEQVTGKGEEKKQKKSEGIFIFQRLYVWSVPPKRREGESAI